MTRLKTMTVAALALGTLISAGVVALAATRPDPASPSPPAPSPATIPPRVADEPKAPAHPDGRRAHRGGTRPGHRRSHTERPASAQCLGTRGRRSSSHRRAPTPRGPRNSLCPPTARYVYLGASRLGFVPQAIRWDRDANAPPARSPPLPDGEGDDRERPRRRPGRQARRRGDRRHQCLEALSEVPAMGRFQVGEDPDRRERPLVVLRRPREARFGRAGGLPPRFSLGGRQLPHGRLPAAHRAPRRIGDPAPPPRHARRGDRPVGRGPARRRCRGLLRPGSALCQRDPPGQDGRPGTTDARDPAGDDHDPGGPGPGPRPRGPHDPRGDESGACRPHAPGRPRAEGSSRRSRTQADRGRQGHFRLERP